jgi:hypothetical protein
VCPKCKTPEGRARQVRIAVAVDPEYKKKLIDCVIDPVDLVYAQTLSCVDISTTFEKRAYGYLSGEVQHARLLDTPFLLWDAKLQKFDNQLPAAITQFVGSYFRDPQAIKPAWTAHLALFEHKVPKYGIPLVDLTALRGVNSLRNHCERGPTGATARATAAHPLNMSSLVDVGQAVLCPADVSKKAYSVCALIDRLLGEPLELLLNSKGDSLTAGLASADLAIFPMLHPDGIGFRPPPWGKGRTESISMKDCNQTRMNSLYSLYTMYPPYIHIAYTLQRTAELVNSVKEEVLAQDLKRYKKEHPGSNDAQAMAHVVRNVLPGTLDGTPGYFRAKRADLLTACSEDNLGMPQFFVTLTEDNSSDHRWGSASVLDEQLKKINEGLDWSHAPAETDRLFFARLRLFIMKFLRPKVC